MSTYLKCPICGGTERSLLPASVCEECGCDMTPVPPCGLTILRACALPLGHEGRCEIGGASDKAADEAIALNKGSPKADRAAAMCRLAAAPAPAVGWDAVANGVVQVCPECDIHGCKHQRTPRPEAPPETSRAQPCPECGGSLKTWGCTCTPRWPMEAPTPARGGEDCPIPPSGWWCTRAPGHEGPCAALRIEP